MRGRGRRIGRGVERRGYLLRRTAVLAAAGVGALASRVARGDSVWNVGSGAWSGAANWLPAGVPASGTNAVIVKSDAVDRTVTYDFTYPFPYALASLTVSNSGTGGMTFRMEGANRLATTGSEIFGTNGHATVYHSAGTNEVGGALQLGVATGGSGTYYLGGTASLSVGGDTRVGSAGEGVVQMNGGAMGASGNLMLGYAAGGTGTVRLFNGNLTVGGELRVGGAGTGAFVQTGGVLSTSGGVSTVGYFGPGTMDQSGGSAHFGAMGLDVGGAYTLSGATTSMTVENEEAIWGNGVLTQSGGTNTVNGVVYIWGSSARAALSGGTWSIAADLLLSKGSLTQSGGTLSGGMYEVGSDSAGTGAVLHTGGAATFGSLRLGAIVGASGAYTMSNTARLTVTGTETIGMGGTGALTQSAGTHSAGGLSIGEGMSGAGTFNLDGGSVVVSGSTRLGSYGGQGVFVQTGGSHTASTSLLLTPLVVGLVGAAPSSSYRMGGGRLSTPLLEIGRGGPASFTYSGGSATASAVNVYSQGTLTLNGGTSTLGPMNQDGTLIVTAPAQVSLVDLGLGSSTTVDSTLTVWDEMTDPVGAAIGGNGRLVFKGGLRSLTGFGVVTPAVESITGTLQASGGSLVLTAPTFFNNEFMGNAVGASLVVLATSVTNTGSVTVNAQGASSFAAPLTILNGRRVTLVGGALSTPTLTNNSGGTVSGSGQIVGNVTNAGTVTFNGPTQLYGRLVNQATGVLTVRNSQLLVTGSATNGGTIRAQAGGTVVFDGGLSGNPVQGAVALESGAGLLTSYLRQGSLTLAGTAGAPAVVATVRPHGQGGDTSVLGALSIPTDMAGVPLGRLDLADNALVVDYTGASPLPTLRARLTSGYNAAGPVHWTGMGVTSSSAAADAATSLGYAEAADVLHLSGTATAAWHGQTVDATSVLVDYVLSGDADLSGGVDFNDLVRLAQNYNVTDGARTWATGDFTFDGNVDFNDLVKLAQNYNRTGPDAAAVSELGAEFGAAVWAAFAVAPEPAGAVLGLVGIAGVMLWRRGRRRRQC